MSLHAALKDVLLYTASHSKFPVVKLQGDDEGTKLFAADQSKKIIMSATLREPLEELKGTIGFGSLPFLSGIMNLTAFKKDATVTVNYREKNGEQVAESIDLMAADGSRNCYRFMNEAAIPAMPVMRNLPEWDVVFKPTKAKIQEFAQLAGVYSQLETSFHVKAEGGNLYFGIGSDTSATHRASLLFSTTAEGDFSSVVTWPIDLMLAVLKLTDGENAIIRITTKKTINVEIDSGLGIYNFYLLANNN